MLLDALIVIWLTLVAACFVGTLHLIALRIEFFWLQLVRPGNVFMWIPRNSLNMQDVYFTASPTSDCCAWAYFQLCASATCTDLG